MNIIPYAEMPDNSKVGQRVTIESSDVGQARDAMAELCCDHSLQVANARTMRFRHSRINLSSVQLIRIEYATDVQVQFADIGEFYIISLPISGTQELRQGAKVTSSNSKQGIIISPSQPVSLKMSGDCRKSMVQISRTALEQQLATLLGRPVTEPVVFDLSMGAEKGSSASWWRTARYVEQEQCYAESLYINELFLDHAEQMLISGLLYCQPHNYTTALRSDSHVRPPYVRRAELFIQAHARDPITIEDIVEVAEVSRRTLYRGFKCFHGTAPLNFLRAVRMQGAREDLLNSCARRNITSVALTWGFTHLGRFSINYKRLFGESPSDTMRR